MSNQPASTHLPEAFLSGINVAHGIMGTVEFMTKELDVELLQLGPLVAIAARNSAEVRAGLHGAVCTLGVHNVRTLKSYEFGSDYLLVKINVMTYNKGGSVEISHEFFNDCGQIASFLQGSLRGDAMNARGIGRNRETFRTDDSLYFKRTFFYVASFTVSVCFHH